MKQRCTFSAPAKKDIGGAKPTRPVQRSAWAPSSLTPRKMEQRPLHPGQAWSEGGSTRSFASTITSVSRRKVVEDEEEDDEDGEWVITLDPPLKTEDSNGRNRGGGRSRPPSDRYIDRTKGSCTENEDRTTSSAPVRALMYFLNSPLCIVGLLLVLLARFTHRVGLLELLPFLVLIKMAEVLLPWADFVANSPTAAKFKSATIYLNRKVVEFNEPPPDPDAAWRSVDLFVAKAFVVKTASFAVKQYNKRSNSASAGAQMSFGGMANTFKAGG